MQQSATLFVAISDGDNAPLWQALSKGGEPFEVRGLHAVEGGVLLQLAGTLACAGTLEDERDAHPMLAEAVPLVASHRLLLSACELSLGKLLTLCDWLRSRATLVDIGLVRSLLDEQRPAAIQLLLHEPQCGADDLQQLAELLEADLNLITMVPQLAQPGLLLMDMDSTAIQIECIDEIAKLAGVGEQVAAVTELAMQGRLDFSESLRARVATLKDHPVTILEQVAAAIPITQGLPQLIAALHQRGWQVGIVSGGFTFFTERLKPLLGLDFTHANTLGIEGGRLSGIVIGEIVDASIKARTLREWADSLGLDMRQTVAAGDGANDLKMLAAAGLGVAFHAKPVVRAQAAAAINSGGIEAIYYLLADTRDLL